MKLRQGQNKYWYKSIQRLVTFVIILSFLSHDMALAQDSTSSQCIAPTSIFENFGQYIKAQGLNLPLEVSAKLFLAFKTIGEELFPVKKELLEKGRLFGNLVKLFTQVDENYESYVRFNNKSIRIFSEDDNVFFSVDLSIILTNGTTAKRTVYFYNPERPPIRHLKELCSKWFSKDEEYARERGFWIIGRGINKKRFIDYLVKHWNSFTDTVKGLFVQEFGKELTARVEPVKSAGGLKIGRLTAEESRYMRDFILPQLTEAFRRIAENEGDVVPNWMIMQIAENLVRLKDGAVRQFTDEGIIPSGIAGDLIDRRHFDITLLAKNMRVLALTYIKAGISDSGIKKLLARFVNPQKLGDFIDYMQRFVKDEMGGKGGVSPFDAVNLLYKYAWTEMTPHQALHLAKRLLDKYKGKISPNDAIYFVSTYNDPEGELDKRIVLADRLQKENKIQRLRPINGANGSRDKTYLHTEEEVPFSDAWWFVTKWNLNEAEDKFREAVKFANSCSVLDVSYSMAMFYVKSHGFEKAPRMIDEAIGEAQRLLELFSAEGIEVSKSDILFFLQRKGIKNIEANVRTALKRRDKLSKKHKISPADAIRVVKGETTIEKVLAEMAVKKHPVPVKSTDGFIRQGKRALKAFRTQAARIRGNDVTEKYRERISGLIEELDSLLRGNDSVREVLLNFSENRVKIYGFNGIVKGKDDFFLGWNNTEGNELFIAEDLVAELEARGPPSLVDEYLLHEILCPVLGHYQSIDLQKTIFPDHYTAQALSSHSKGLLGKALREFIHYSKRNKQIGLIEKMMMKFIDLIFVFLPGQCFIGAPFVSFAGSIKEKTKGIFDYYVMYRIYGYFLKKGYRIERQIHKGQRMGERGMGRVYEAFDIKKQRKVIIKIGISAFRETRHLFYANGSSAIDGHPNIACPVESGILGSLMGYSIFEFAEGRTLEDWIGLGRNFTIQEALNIVLQIISGIEYMHSKSIKHGDLWLRNIMMDNSGKIKIIDMEAPLSRIVGETDEFAVDIYHTGKMFIQLLFPENRTEDRREWLPYFSSVIKYLESKGAEKIYDKEQIERLIYIIKRIIVTGEPYFEKEEGVTGYKTVMELRQDLVSLQGGRYTGIHQEGGKQASEIAVDVDQINVDEVWEKEDIEMIRTIQNLECRIKIVNGKIQNFVCVNASLSDDSDLLEGILILIQKRLQGAVDRLFGMENHLPALDAATQEITIRFHQQTTIEDETRLGRLPEFFQHERQDVLELHPLALLSDTLLLYGLRHELDHAWQVYPDGVQVSSSLEEDRVVTHDRWFFNTLSLEEQEALLSHLSPKNPNGMDVGGKVYKILRKLYTERLAAEDAMGSEFSFQAEEPTRIWHRSNKYTYRYIDEDHPIDAVIGNQLIRIIKSKGELIFLVYSLYNRTIPAVEFKVCDNRIIKIGRQKKAVGIVRDEQGREVSREPVDNDIDLPGTNRTASHRHLKLTIQNIKAEKTRITFEDLTSLNGSMLYAYGTLNADPRPKRVTAPMIMQGDSIKIKQEEMRRFIKQLNFKIDLTKEGWIHELGLKFMAERDKLAQELRADLRKVFEEEYDEEFLRVWVENLSAFKEDILFLRRMKINLVIRRKNGINDDFRQLVRRQVRMLRRLPIGLLAKCREFYPFVISEDQKEMPERALGFKRNAVHGTVMINKVVFRTSGTFSTASLGHSISVSKVMPAIQLDEKERKEMAVSSETVCAHELYHHLHLEELALSVRDFIEMLDVSGNRRWFHNSMFGSRKTIRGSLPDIIEIMEEGLRQGEEEAVKMMIKVCSEYSMMHSTFYTPAEIVSFCLSHDIGAENELGPERFRKIRQIGFRNMLRSEKPVANRIIAGRGEEFVPLYEIYAFENNRHWIHYGDKDGNILIKDNYVIRNDTHILGEKDRVAIEEAVKKMLLEKLHKMPSLAAVVGDYITLLSSITRSPEFSDKQIFFMEDVEQVLGYIRDRDLLLKVHGYINHAIYTAGYQISFKDRYEILNKIFKDIFGPVNPTEPNGDRNDSAQSNGLGLTRGLTNLLGSLFISTMILLGPRISLADSLNLARPPETTEDILNAIRLDPENKLKTAWEILRDVEPEIYNKYSSVPVILDKEMTEPPAFTNVGSLAEPVTIRVSVPWIQGISDDGPPKMPFHLARVLRHEIEHIIEGEGATNVFKAWWIRHKYVFFGEKWACEKEMEFVRKYNEKYNLGADCLEQMCSVLSMNASGIAKYFLFIGSVLFVDFIVLGAICWGAWRAFFKKRVKAVVGRQIRSGRRGDGYIYQGDKSKAEFEAKIAEIRKNDVTEKYGERISSLIKGLDSRLRGNDSVREVLLSCSENRVKIYGFNGIVKGKDDFFLGWNNTEGNELFIAEDLIAELEARGPPSLVDEYLLHEILCPVLGHYQSIDLQKTIFPDHYTEQVLLKHSKGLLGEAIRNFIKKGLRLTEKRTAEEAGVEIVGGIKPDTGMTYYGSYVSTRDEVDQVVSTLFNIYRIKISIDATNGKSATLIGPGNSVMEILGILRECPNLRRLNVIEAYDKNVIGLKKELDNLPDVTKKELRISERVKLYNSDSEDLTEVLGAGSQSLVYCIGVLEGSQFRDRAKAQRIFNQIIECLEYGGTALVETDIVNVKRDDTETLFKSETRVYLFRKTEGNNSRQENLEIHDTANDTANFITREEAIERYDRIALLMRLMVYGGLKVDIEKNLSDICKHVESLRRKPDLKSGFFTGENAETDWITIEDKIKRLLFLIEELQENISGEQALSLGVVELQDMFKVICLYAQHLRKEFIKIKDKYGDITIDDIYATGDGSKFKDYIERMLAEAGDLAGNVFNMFYDGKTDKKVISAADVIKITDSLLMGRIQKWYEAGIGSGNIELNLKDVGLFVDSNLLSFALAMILEYQYAEGGSGKMTINVLREGDNDVIRIDNAAIHFEDGMLEETALSGMQNIFTIRHAEKRPGMWLGLGFLYYVVNDHGGTVSISNTQEGKGRFEIIIPCKPRDDGQGSEGYSAGMQLLPVREDYYFEDVLVNRDELKNPGEVVKEARAKVELFKQDRKRNKICRLDVNNRTDSYNIIEYKGKFFVVREKLLELLGYSEQSFLANLSKALARSKAISGLLDFDSLPEVMVVELMDASPYFGANCTGDGWIGINECLGGIAKKEIRDIVFRSILAHEMTHETNYFAKEKDIEPYDLLFLFWSIVDSGVTLKAAKRLLRQYIHRVDILYNKLLETKNRILRELIDNMAHNDPYIRKRSAQMINRIVYKIEPRKGFVFVWDVEDWLKRHGLLTDYRIENPAGLDVDEEKARLYGEIIRRVHRDDAEEVERLKEVVRKFCRENSISEPRNLNGYDTPWRIRPLIRDWIVPAMVDLKLKVIGGNLFGESIEGKAFEELRLWPVDINGRLRTDLLGWMWRWQEKPSKAYLEARRVSLKEFYTEANAEKQLKLELAPGRDSIRRIAEGIFEKMPDKYKKVISIEDLIFVLTDQRIPGGLPSLSEVIGYEPKNAVRVNYISRYIQNISYELDLSEKQRQLVLEITAIKFLLALKVKSDETIGGIKKILDDLGYGHKTDEIVNEIMRVKAKPSRELTQTDCDFVTALEYLLGYKKGKIAKWLGIKQKSVFQKKGEENGLKDFIYSNIAQWNTLRLLKGKSFRGVIVQHIRDYGPGVKNWLAAVKKYNVNIDGVKMAYITAGLSEEEKRQVLAHKPDNVILGDTLEEIRIKAEVDNIVYLADNGEIEKYKNQDIKLIEKGNAGPLLELNLGLLLLNTDKQDIENVYRQYIDELKDWRFEWDEDVEKIIQDFKTYGYIRLPKIQKVLEMWNSLQESASYVDMWA